jgi:3-isopropylmalate/(R)-2-methylmalate dehydratase large subunit
VSAPLTLRQLQTRGVKPLSRPLIIGLDSAPSPSRGISNDHLFLREFAEKSGAIITEIGDGIGQEIAIESYANPGTIVLGSDSHLVYLGRTWFQVPETIKVAVRGHFADGVHAKDLVLYLLGRIGAEGASYKALEYEGEAVDEMSMAGRLTVASMAVEAGAKVGLFPADEMTKQYLTSRGRGLEYRLLRGDPDARYDQVIEIDATQLEPMVAKPHRV